MTTIMVATTGGHLAQLVELSPRLPQVGTDRLWVTFDTPQSRSLLAGEAVRFIPFISERDVLGVARRGELVDNHQREIAEWLAGRGLALHRSPETLAAGDLEQAAACRVRRVALPPPFTLANAA